MKTAAAYIRVSTGEQTEFSPASQLKAIKNYAAANGLEIPERFIFSDEGISGRSANKRPGFQKMIAIAKTKPSPFSVILIWKFSRFARSRKDSIIYKTLLRHECGIEVISVSEQLSQDNTSVLIEALIEAMDEYYSLNLAEEVRRGMQEKFSRGGVVSQPPIGYITGNGGFIPDPENAPIVKYIFSSYLSGSNMSQIAQELNSMGFTTVRGKPFERRSVEYIITNPVYTGKLRRSKSGGTLHDRFHQNLLNVSIVQGKHQAIISEKSFQLAQEIYKSSSKLASRHFRNSCNTDYMLRGIVRCSSCGGTLILQRKSQCLQCQNYAKRKCNVSHGISLNKIINSVFGELLKDYSGVIEITISDSRPNEIPVNELIARQQQMLNNAQSAYCSGVDTLEEYAQKKRQILQSIDNLQKIETYPPIIQKVMYTDLKILQSNDTSVQLKNLILRSLISSIVLIKPNNSLEINYLL